ncbi:MAG: pyruvate dehydrogenase (acetyl-transferring), homodimeric type, partial [Deltaproteobacteria bacterium]
MTDFASQLPDRDPAETAEWREALTDIIAHDGPYRAGQVLRATLQEAATRQVGLPPLVQTPYINTIPPTDEPAYPGDLAMEKRVRQIIRWNAAMMVGRANKKHSGLGGHLSSYASSANLYEMGFNHFFTGPGDDNASADMIYYQGHAVPGMYARAYLEGRLTEENLEHFRRETGGKGLSSYPHPYSMPNFWQFPT